MERKKFVMVEKDVPTGSKTAVASKSFAMDNLIRMSERFAAANRLITRDLNGRRQSGSLTVNSKDNITKYLQDPAKNQKELREAATYIYGASSHFRRLIQYFTGLTDLSYVLSPSKIDTSTAKASTVGKQYRKALNVLASMDIKNQFPKIITVCLREDTFFGTMRVTNDNIMIQQLPSDYCDIAVIENNVLNVSFDFSYFDRNNEYLALYPDEFSVKYRKYLKDKQNLKWQELASPTSFAVKCNNDILNYSIPPFVGMFREVYDLEDYKKLKMSKTELENYAMLVMKLGINKDGEWEMDFDKAREFYQNLDDVLPEEVGAVLSPMAIDKISFDPNARGDRDSISEAEQNLFTAAGVSTLLFNNDKASSNALLLSIKADQAITYGIVRSIEDVVNRYIQSFSYGRNFKVTFLDCSPYNRKEVGDQYLKAAQYGMPTISYYCASQGLSQSEMDCMNFLEDSVLALKDRFVPLRSSATMSGKDDGKGATPEGGRPPKDAEDLSDAGEASRENEDGDDSNL